MLGFMAVSGIFGARNLQKLNLTVRLPEEIYCNVPVQATIRLHSRRRLLPHYLLTILLKGSTAEFPLLEPNSTMEKKLPITFRCRGLSSISEAVVTSPFPVNFFIRSNSFSLTETCLVFPEPLPPPGDWLGGNEQHTGSIMHNSRGGSDEVESIGTYSEREPLRHIHWKLSARHDDLLVREMSDLTGKTVIIDLERLPGDIEERLRYAVFLINTRMSSGMAVGLIIGEKYIPPGRSTGERLRMLAELAQL